MNAHIREGLNQIVAVGFEWMSHENGFLLGNFVFQECQVYPLSKVVWRTGVFPLGKEWSTCISYFRWGHGHQIYQRGLVDVA